MKNKVAKLIEIEWEKLKWLQGDLKKISKENIEKIKTSFRENGFVQPFFVWKDDAGEYWILDGHHRIKVLRAMKEEGADVPVKLPAIEIEAESREAAAKMVLIYSSSYAEITEDGLKQFSLDFNLDLSSVENYIDINIDISTALPQVERKEEVYLRVQKGDEFILDGKHRILCEEAKKENILRMISSIGDEKRIFEVYPSVFNLPYSTLKKPITEKTKRIVSFSGGKDSTAMLLVLIEEGIRIDEVLNVNLGDWEWEEVLANVKKMREFVEKRNIKFTELIPEKSLFEYIPARGFPNQFVRWCSGIKIDLMKKYLKERFPDGDYVEYVGIAYDEATRAYKKTIREKRVIYPLIERKITEQKAFEISNKYGFDFFGIYKDRQRTGCWCCPLQSKADLKRLYNEHPEKWNKLREIQKVSHQSFHLGHTSLFLIEHKYWLEKFEHNKLQTNERIYKEIKKTEKNEIKKEIELLKRETKEGDVVFDRLADVGNFLFAAEKIKRIFIGIEEDEIFVDIILRKYKRVFPQAIIEVIRNGRIKDVTNVFTESH